MWSHDDDQNKEGSLITMTHDTVNSNTYRHVGYDRFEKIETKRSGVCTCERDREKGYKETGREPTKSTTKPRKRSIYTQDHRNDAYESMQTATSEAENK